VAKPEAVFDLLRIGSSLQNYVEKLNASDIHVFSYLACLLAVFKGIPTADWGYSFAGTDVGAPYSVDIEEAIRGAQAASLLNCSADGFMVLQPEAANEMLLLASFGLCSWRHEFLDAATDSVLNLSTGLVKSAVGREPNLRPVTTVRSSRKLLEGPGLELLYEQFDVLAQAVGGRMHDLMVPATVWLTYLARKALAAQETTTE
jgi:hypothetical protein